MSESPTWDTPTQPYDHPDNRRMSEPVAPPRTAITPHPGYYQQPSAAPYAAPGKIRSTGLCIFLAIITLGIYSIVWFYQTHEEMKRHTGHGLGGGLALVLSIFVGFVMPYITASEVGALFERSGQRKPVSGATGLWYFPGMFLLVGPLVWFIKTNGALNAYWRSQGVR